MISFLKRLLRDRRGNVLVIAGAGLPLLVGAAGLATDTIQWAMWKRQLQRAADSGAIAGVYDRNANGDSSANTQAAVLHDLSLNHHTGLAWVNNPVVTFPADSGDMTNLVDVVLTVSKPLPFSGMFLDDAPVITATARAASVPGSDEYCVVALENSSTKTGITIGGNTKIEMDCGFISNSPSSNKSAINNGNAAQVDASVIASVGGMQYSTNWTVDKYDPYATAVTDPYASLDPAMSEMSGCASNPPAATEATSVPTGTATLCFGSITVSSNQTWDLGSDKTIFVTGRNANTAGGVVLHGTLTCDNCTIILSNKDASSTAKIGQFDMRAQSALDITAPTSGKYRGIAVFQDRRASDVNQSNTFNGGGTQAIEGALYFPSQELTYSGNGSATALCTRFVGRRVTFTGTSAALNRFEKGSNCAGLFGNDPIGGGRRVRLVA